MSEVETVLARETYIATSGLNISTFLHKFFDLSGSLIVLLAIFKLLQMPASFIFTAGAIDLTRSSYLRMYFYFRRHRLNLINVPSFPVSTFAVDINLFHLPSVFISTSVAIILTLSTYRHIDDFRYHYINVFHLPSYRRLQIALYQCVRLTVILTTSGIIISMCSSYTSTFCTIISYCSTYLRCLFLLPVSSSQTD